MLLSMNQAMNGESAPTPQIAFVPPPPISRLAFAPTAPLIVPLFVISPFPPQPPPPVEHNFTPLNAHHTYVPPHINKSNKQKQPNVKRLKNSASIVKGSMLMLSGFTDSSLLTNNMVRTFFGKLGGGIKKVCKLQSGQVILLLPGKRNNLALRFWERVLLQKGGSTGTNNNPTTVTFYGQEISGRVLTSEEEQHYGKELSQLEAGKKKKVGWELIALSGITHSPKATIPIIDLTTDNEEDEESPHPKSFILKPWGEKLQKALSVSWHLNPESHKEVETNFRQLFPGQNPPTEREVLNWKTNFLQSGSTSEPDKEAKSSRPKRVAEEIEIDSGDDSDDSVVVIG